MANELDLLAQAAQASQLIPDASADAEWVPPATTPSENKMSGLQKLGQSKMATVARASLSKQQSMTPADYFANAVGATTGKGRDTASDIEKDLRDLSPVQIMLQYGEEEGSKMIAGQAGGYSKLIQADTALARTKTELWDDANVGIAQGLGAGLGGLAALGAGVFSDTAGTALAQGVGAFNDFMEDSQSPRLQARQEVKQTKDALDARDSAAKQIEEAASTDKLTAGFRRIGRDVVSSLSNATDDPATFGAGVANALGSFLVAGPVSKGIQVATKGALGTTTAIAATEAGGAYAQSAEQIMDMNHDQLMEGSNYYRALIEQGASPDSAKRATANSAALTAATLTAPAAALAGRLVHKFEGNVAALGSGKQLLGNIGRETVEEASQSGTGQLAQNIATQQIADSNQVIAEGVGQQIAEGALYGMGMTTALGIPSVVIDASKKGASKASSIINDRLANIDESNRQKSRVSDAAVAQAGSEAATTAPAAEQVLREAVAAAPADQQEAGNAYVDQLMSASNFDPAETPAAYNGMFDDVTTRTGAIQRAAEIVGSSEAGSNEQLRAGFFLYDLVNDYAAAINQNPDALSALPADNQASQIVAQYQNLMGAIQSSPKVMDALGTVMDILEKSQPTKVDVSAQSVATPEGQQEVKDVLTSAEIAPDKVDLGTAEKILYQISQGNLTVTPRQKAALDTAVALLRAVQKADQLSQQMGKSDPVSLNITSEYGEKGKSLTQHAKGIMSAWKANDFDLAAGRLTDLKNFAQGMSNKVGALNSHLASGKPANEGMHYEVFSGGKATPSKLKVGVTPTDIGSVEFAQKVAREAELLVDVYNGLSTAFPNIKAKHMAVTPLAKELVGSPSEVVSRFKNKTQPVQKAENTPAPVTAPTPKTEPVKKAEPAVKVVEPKETAPVPKTSPVTLDSLDIPSEILNKMPAREKADPEVAELIHRDRRVKSEEKESDPDTWTPEQKKLYENGEYEKFSVSRGYTKDEIDNFNRYVELVGVLDSRYGENYSGSLLYAIEVAAFPSADNSPDLDKLKGTAALFPRLINGAKNLFNRSFKLPKEQRTRTIGEEAPVDFVRAALKDSASLTAAVGSEIKGNYTPEIAKAYASYLSVAEDFISEMDDNLQEFLDSKYSKSDNRTIGQIIKEGIEVVTGSGEIYDPLRSVRGKALNITEEGDGTLVYNPELIQSATLAGLQWFLNVDQYGSEQDASDIAKLLGMDEATVDPNTVEALNQGINNTEAKRSLGSKIRSFWGVQNESDGAIGYQEGIPEAIAAEILRVMTKGGWLTESKVHLTEADGLPPRADGTPNVLDFIQLIPGNIDEVFPGKDGERSPLREFPSAIEQAVMVEPEDVNFIGGDLPPVAKEQLRNPGVKNTTQQLKMIENEQSTPYNVNMFMAGFYSAIGRDQVLSLFGVPDVDAKTTNVNHAKTLEGVNRSVLAAYDHLQGLLAQVQNVGDLATTPIHYAFNMTRVARLQMLGKYNPQSNKFIREAILPTFSTLDLTKQTGKDYKRFMLGVSQMLGVKVHKVFQAVSRSQAETMLNGPLAPAVEALGNWTKGFDDSAVLAPASMLDASTIDILKSSFNAAGVDLTPMALHAIMDYARYQNADDKSAFRTATYVEADGVTNGPINAMMLFTTGFFKANWIRNIAKGGIFFNRPGETVNSNNESGDSRDLYQATTDALDSRLGNLRKVLSSDARGTEQMNAMLHLMDLFYGKDLSFTDNDDGSYTLSLQRGIAKNPLTITIYGSGAGGIAAKMTRMLTDAMYERMTQVAQARAAGETNLAVAMFGPQSVSVEDVEAKLSRFIDSYGKLTNTMTGQRKDGTLFFKVNQSDKAKRTFDPVNFTVGTHELGNIQSNIRYLFVDPMRDAIRETVGGELLDTAEMLRKATQAQSIVLEHAFKTEVEAALAEKAKDPDWRKGDFLTRGELDAIHKKLEHLSPLIEAEDQNFYIAGSQKADLKLTQFSRALNNRFGSPAYVAGPSDAGVSGIPFLNIGAGDGRMMQIISTMSNAIKGTLKIFDGMNMPLDKIEEGSAQANEAALQAMLGNPLKAVHKTFDQFMSDAKLTGFSDEARLALSKAIYGLQSEAVSEQAILEGMQELLAGLNTAQRSIEARHNVIRRVNVSADQMAAVGVPHEQTGDLALMGTDPDSIADQMNVHYLTELSRLDSSTPTGSASKALDSIAVDHSTGAKVVQGSQLKHMAINLTPDQAAVMHPILASKAADDYKIVYGTPEQLANYAQETGASADAINGVQGAILLNSKTIMLVNPSTETLLHELVHATTFQVIASHYAGESTKQVADAVKRIEGLSTDFLNQEDSLTQGSPELHDSYLTAKRVINSYMTQGDQASALNEFMAWTLTNGHLNRIAKRTEASKLSQLKNRVVTAIKSLLGIKADVGKDVFSNLLFNSSVLMQAQSSLSERFASGILFMNSSFGSNQRIADINYALNKTIGRYLSEPTTARRIDQADSFSTGVQNAYRVAQSFMSHGFNMTAQESSAFNTIVTALSTEANIDPNSMAAVQQIYSHVMKNLSPESFMKDPDSTDAGVYDLAAEKFDVLSGKFLVTRDLAGRSSLLPAFLALATVNDEFREVLSKIALPKTALNKDGTLDALLENYGNKMMDKLGERMAGSSKAKNVQEAIDLLNANMSRVINQRDTLIDQTFKKAGGIVDRTNDFVVNGFNALSAAGLKLAKRAERNGAGRVERAAAGIVAGFSAMLNEQAAQGVAKSVMASINKTKMWDAAHTLINDFVGRTDNNAPIYDMIKAVRAVVQRTRQQYVLDLPKILGDKFTRELTPAEKASLHSSVGKTDLAALGKDALKLASDHKASISAIEKDLSSSQHWNLVQAKAKQLAHYMITGEAGVYLLRNPEAISRLLGQNVKVTKPVDVTKLDQLISLYAFDLLSQEDKATFTDLVSTESTGLSFTLDYLSGQRTEEKRKATGRASLNYFKGYIPDARKESASMLVAHDTEQATLLAKSYERIADYNGSPLETGQYRSYFFVPVSARASYEQGIMQNVQQTAGGVDASTGFTTKQTAGRVTFDADVKALTKRIHRDGGLETFMPVFDSNGDVLAYERSLDPKVMSRLIGEQDLHASMGKWQGRQVEEGFSQMFNEALVNRLNDMYVKDVAANVDNERQYVDLFNTNDPVWRDAVSLLNHETRAYVNNTFGNRFMVRRDMINDALGYRAASIGDAWTGNTRWNQQTQNVVRKIATVIMGNDAYKNMVGFESKIQTAVVDAKSLIVVKSVVVPAVNILSNIYQLIARGVPLKHIATSFPAKGAEVEAYTKSLVRRIEAEAELRSAHGDVRIERRLKTEIQAIDDSHRRMSIWPLIEAGELSSVAGADINRSDIQLTSGRLQAYMEQAAQKLPGWGSTIGRYALITQDTALYKGLQKAVEYGDFLAKAVQYDDLVNRKGMSQKEALAIITERFINYDRLPGRFRGSMEKLGLLWFYNFKIRAVKDAASMVRNNPVHTLISTSMPTPDMFGTVGLPTADNMISKLIDGTLDYSIGPGQGLRSMMLNPWINITQ